MRADRLVALLLLLQQRQRVTAAMVAAELEISERTARRDLEALCMAGLPVYSERGRGGGWRLLGGGRTDLSGLTAQEARALFLVAGPASAATPELKAALRKLVRALPESFRSSAEAAASSVVLDPRGWGRNRPPYRPRHLDGLQSATTEGLQVRLGYSDRTGNATVRTVHPLGLAQKGTTWYLLAGTDEGLRTFRVSRVRSVEPTGEPVVRPEGFELSRSWEEVVERVEGLRSLAEVFALADPDVVDALHWLFEGHVSVGERVGGNFGESVRDSDAGDRVPVVVRGQRVEMIARQLSAFGDHLEVVGPPEARQVLARLGQELFATYGPSGTDGTPGTHGLSGADSTPGTHGLSGADSTASTSGTDGTHGTSRAYSTASRSGTTVTRGTAGTDGAYSTASTSGTASTQAKEPLSGAEPGTPRAPAGA